MWLKKSKLFCLLLVLLCFSFSAYSQDEQADITIAELQQLLDERESFKTELTLLKQTNEAIKSELQTLQAESMKREQELAILKIESQIRTDSLNALKSETTLTKLASFGAGFSLGVGATAIAFQFSP